jgi:hypothetical protein
MYLKTNTKPGDANSLRSCKKKVSVMYLYLILVIDIWYTR